MKNEKGISNMVLFVIIALIIIAVLWWAKYFSKPMATVMMQGAEQAKPAVERAQQASDSVNRANKAAEDAVTKVNEDAANKINEDAK